MEFNAPDVLERENQTTALIRLHSTPFPHHRRKSVTNCCLPVFKHSPPVFHIAEPFGENSSCHWKLCSQRHSIINSPAATLFSPTRTFEHFMSFARRQIILWPFSPTIAREFLMPFSIFNDEYTLLIISLWRLFFIQNWAGRIVRKKLYSE